MSNSSGVSGSEGRWVGILLLVLALTFGIHVPSIGNSFVFDDHFTAKSSTVEGVYSKKQKRHEMVADLQPITEYFTSHYLRGGGDSRGYRPLTVWSFALVYQIFGKNAANEAMPQRLLNILLQTLNTWLVFLLILRVCGGYPAAVLGALVFGVHAVHHGVLGSIVGRGELLAFAFGASAACVFLAGSVKQRMRPGRLLSAGLLLFLAFCSKESSVAWLVLVPLAEMVRRWLAGQSLQLGRITRHAAIVGVLPFVVFLALRAYALHDVSYQPDYLGNPLYYESWGNRLAAAASLWVFAIYKLLVPFFPTSDYGPNVLTVDMLVGWQSLAAGAVVLALLVVALLMARRRPLFFLAVATFYGFWFITSNVPFGLETIYADRLLYTPSLALSLLVASCAWRWQAGLAKAGLVVLLVWSLASAIVSAQRVLWVWVDNDTLFAHDLEQRPDSLRMLLASVTLGQAKKGEAAVQELYKRALQVEPDFPMVLLNRGTALMLEGKTKEAREMFIRGLQSPLLDKGFRREEGSKLSYNLGVVELTSGRRHEAVPLFKQSIAWMPKYWDPYYALLRVQYEGQDMQGMGETLTQAHKQDPGNPTFHVYAGLFEARSGRFAEAARRLGTFLPQVPSGRAPVADWFVLVECLIKIDQKDSAKAVLDRALKMLGDPPPEVQGRIAELRRQIGK